MENTNQPDLPQEPKEAPLSIEERLALIEKRIEAQSSVPEKVPAENRRLERSELSAELEHHRDQLRDYEKALVERIADVDDDRRATASRLQRAWQTQREEIDDRLRRHAGLLAGLLMLFAVVFAVALLVVYRQATIGPSTTVVEATEARQQPAPIPAKTAIPEQVRAELDELNARVEEIAAALQQLEPGTDQEVKTHIAAERAAREKAEEEIAAVVRHLDAERKRLTRELGVLRSNLETLEVGAASEPEEVDAPEPLAEDFRAAPDAGAEAGEIEEGHSVSRAADGENGATEAGTGPAARDPDTAVSASASASAESVIAGGDIYALQLIGFFSRSSLDEFVDRAELPAKVYSARQSYRGRPWHVLIHSLHDDYAAAEEELSRLSEDLVALDPWIRPLSEVTELKIIETRKASQ